MIRVDSSSRSILHRISFFIGVALAGTPLPSAVAATDSFTSPGADTWTVPTGVTSVTVVVTGAGGAGSSYGPSSPSAGGGGAQVTKVITTAGGEVLSLFVGGGAASPLRMQVAEADRLK